MLNRSGERAAVYAALLSLAAAIGCDSNQDPTGCTDCDGEPPIGSLNPFDHARTRWYYIAADAVRWDYAPSGHTEIDVHTPHWHGRTGLWNGMRTDVLELLPASMKVFDMIPDNPGTWLLHCHVNDHLDAGMIALFTVEWVRRGTGHCRGRWSPSTIGDHRHVVLALRPTAGQRTLDPLMVVRIHQGQWKCEALAPRGEPALLVCPEPRRATAAR